MIMTVWQNMSLLRQMRQVPVSLSMSMLRVSAIVRSRLNAWALFFGARWHTGGSSARFRSTCLACWPTQRVSTMPVPDLGGTGNASASNKDFILTKSTGSASATQYDVITAR
jgi:hypothetical protein